MFLDVSVVVSSRSAFVIFLSSVLIYVGAFVANVVLSRYEVDIAVLYLNAFVH